MGGRGRRAVPTIPRGDTVATFHSYSDAQNAVDTLAQADFPVKQIFIVGSDLKSVERVTGKLTYGRAALAGTISGVYLGVFIGLLLFIVAPATMTFVYAIAAVLIGAGFGMLFGVVTYAINRRRRDFTSVMQVLASSYSLIVEPGLVNRARNALDGEKPVPAPSTHDSESDSTAK
jgi:hypothetical protein